MSASDLTRLRDAILSVVTGGKWISVRESSGRLVIDFSGPDRAQHPGFWAEVVTEDAAAEYTVMRQRPTLVSAGGGSADPLTDDTDTYSPVYEVNGVTGLAVGRRVWVRPAGVGSDDEPQWVCDSNDVPANGTFMVALTQTGGATGDATTQASWEYTVKSLDAVTTYATAREPQTRRQNVGKLKAATLGLGYFDASGDFQLAHAFEEIDAQACA